MVKKRGQAAMEFLMTYGWALLVVLVAIGALAFFGVLNPGQFLPSTCTITPGISCDGFKVTATQVDLILTNGMGTNLGTAAGAFTVQLKQADGTECATTPPTASGNSLTDGETEAFVIPNNACDLSSGKARLDVVITYTTDGGLAHSKTGQIVAKVEA
jgi:hypothetical protein